MNFMVQDMLDYAQIRHGTFKKNYSQLNVRDLVAEIMKIQQRQAQERNIEFFAEFTNIAENEDFVENEIFDMHSPKIICDQQRIMQVLLAL